MLDGAWGDGRNECFGGGDRLERRLEIADIRLNGPVPDILEWAAADGIADAKVDGAEVFGKFSLIAAPDLERGLSRTRASSAPRRPGARASNW